MEYKGKGAGIVVQSNEELYMGTYSELFDEFVNDDLTEVLHAFMRASDISATCSVCKQEKWSVLTPTKNGLTGIKLLSATSTGESFYQFVATIVCYCNHCGHQRSHNTLPIFKWWKRSRNN